MKDMVGQRQCFGQPIYTDIFVLAYVLLSLDACADGDGSS